MLSYVIQDTFYGFFVMLVRVLKTLLDVYCLCKSGARMVGCCAHIASVLWYVRYQCHSSDMLVADSVQTEHFLNAADEEWYTGDDDNESSE